VERKLLEERTEWEVNQWLAKYTTAKSTTDV